MAYLGETFTRDDDSYSDLSPEDQLAQAMRDLGFVPPHQIIGDGQIHRFSTNGQPGDTAGWYVLYPDAIPTGAFGDWRSTEGGHTFKAKLDRPLTATELIQLEKRSEEVIKAREAEKKQAQFIASQQASIVWGGARPAPATFPYLKAKGIQPNGVRMVKGQGGPKLALPIYSQTDDTVTSIQYIDMQGGKRFHPAGAIKGGYWWVGPLGDSETVYIAEGFATASSVYEATGMPCVITYSARNLSPVAYFLRKTLGPHQHIVIVGDNDESGTGQHWAKHAGKEHDCAVVIPPIPGMDANDYAQAGHNLTALLEGKVKKEAWLTPVGEFRKQPAPLEWLIKGWLQSKALIMLHGPSGVGKSFTMLDMSMRVAIGLDNWMGCKVKQGFVVYLAGEGHYGMRARVAAWCQHNNIGDEDIDMVISNSGTDLNTAEGLHHVRTSIRTLATPPKLIVVDTVHRFFSGDENNAKDVKTMLDSCAELMQEFNCTVVLVHHTGLNPEAQTRGRGSSAWRGALDVEIGLSPAGDKLFKFTQHKMKDSEELKPIFGALESLAIDGWIDDDGEPVTSAVVVASEAPVDTKDAKRNKALLDNIKAAWVAGGKRFHGERCFMYAEHFKAVQDQQGKGESAAKKAAQRLINAGVEAGVLERVAGGFALVGIDNQAFKMG